MPLQASNKECNGYFQDEIVLGRGGSCVSVSALILGVMLPKGLDPFRDP